MDKTKGKSAIFWNFFILNNEVKTLSYIHGQTQTKIGTIFKNFFIFNNEIKSLSYIRGQNQGKIGPISKIFLIFLIKYLSYIHRQFEA